MTAKRLKVVGACAAATLVLLNAPAGRLMLRASPPAQQRSTSAVVAPRAVFDQYCISCHNEKLKTAGLMLDKLDPAAAGEHPEIWEKVVRKLRSGMMPPTGRPRPDQATYERVRTALEASLDHAAAANPNPGRTEAFHRLNRTEYRNVIRDLLALDVDVSALLPPDDSSFGFDNMAGVLKVNQTGMERYLSAARKISRLAIGVSSPPAGSETFTLSPQLPQYEHVNGLPFGTRGGTVIHYNFPQDGEYGIAVKLQCYNTRGGDENCADGSSGFPDQQQLVVLIDDEIAQEFKFDKTPRRDRYAGDNSTSADGTHTFAEAERLQVRIPVKAGAHDVGVTFLRLPSVETVQRLYRQSFDKPLVYRGVDRGMQITVPHVSKVTISGPFASAGVSDTPSRRAIFVCRAATPADEPGCAKRILASLARRAYRRPVSNEDVEPLLNFYNLARSEGGAFDAGIEDGLRALLTSPEFWFRIEHDPPNVPANAVYRLNSLEIASRLSFFLWSSIPDEELLGLAAANKLTDLTVLDQQVRRMLADPRAKAFSTNFGEQWLNLRRISVVAPNESDFPNFEETLRDAFEQETRMFLDSVMREDHSALDLLNADYTFVNARLAKHYGIPNVAGARFRRVTLPADNPRRGLLGQGSILLVTSHPTRTSPVKRGKFVLEEILGSPPPPPPPNVPELKEAQSQGQVMTMRERMAEHRANPYCAGCHAMIDPVGFALENFDPVGRFRTVDETHKPIDASGSLPDGTKFSDLAGFRAALTGHPDRFLLTLTEKLMTFALGRGVDATDMPAVRKIVRDAAKSDYRFSSLVLGVVNSVPFTMRKAAVGTPARLSASRP
jgi:mono/diheme cytochrome c family protein